MSPTAGFPTVYFVRGFQRDMTTAKLTVADVRSPLNNKRFIHANRRCWTPEAPKKCHRNLTGTGHFGKVRQIWVDHVRFVSMSNVQRESRRPGSSILPLRPPQRRRAYSSVFTCVDRYDPNISLSSWNNELSSDSRNLVDWNLALLM